MASARSSLGLVFLTTTALICGIWLGSSYGGSSIEPVGASTPVALPAPPSAPWRNETPIISAPLPDFRQEMAPAASVSEVQEQENKPAVETVHERLADLEAIVTTLPDYDGTDAGVRRKYEGMTPQELEMVYPMLRSRRVKEMFATLDSAISAGLHQTEIVPAGGKMDFSPYWVPGDSFHVVAHRAEPHSSGGVEYRFLSFDLARFPEVYIRGFEETWVGDRVDEAQEGE